ncbi:MAG: class F sortase [Dehalococcoidia bacterium]|nr:MAG: class F sortase [Dehalococcoidia bacterium]
MTPKRSWRIATLAAAGGVLLVAALTLFVLQCAGVFDEVQYSTPETGTAFNVSTLATAPAGTPVTGSGPPIARLVIPAIGVDAAVIVRGIGADGVMQVPDNARDVAWYDFTAHPGSGGNVVFSGHVDFHGVGPAVFWDLGKLTQDDGIEVRLEDGTSYHYRVTEKGVYNAADAPVDRIVGQTPVESVTIITCTGKFDASTRQYDKRLVVRAELASAPPAPAATAVP